MSIAELSIRRPITTVMCFVTLVVVGLIAAIRLPLEAFPSVSFPVIFMQMPYQGSTPEEVERTLVRPAEEALATLPGIRNIQSTATANGANIMVLFSDGLVERRGVSLVESLEGLRAGLAQVVPTSADLVCDAALAAAPGSTDDDLTVLAFLRPPAGRV